MHRNLLFLFSLTLLGYLSEAQITVTNDNFPEIGDTLKTATDTSPDGIVLGGPGEDKTWDFSSLQGPTVHTIVRDTAGIHGANAFTNADMAVVTQFGNAFYRSTENAYILLGGSGGDVTGLGVDLVAKYDPVIVERRAPMNFFDVNNDDYALNVAFSFQDLPSQLADSIPLAPDSLRISRVSERLDIVDAWGILTLPGGGPVYEVLREKRFEEVETLLEAKITIGSLSFWQEVPTDLVPFLDPFLGLDTIITYNFFGNDSKEPIAVVTVDPRDEITPTSVTFKSSDEVTTSVKAPERSYAEVLVYPNPAIDLVSFNLSNFDAGKYKLRVYNILGSEVFNDSYFVNGEAKLKVDFGYLRKGTYLYNFTDEDGNNITTRRLIITRP